MTEKRKPHGLDECEFGGCGKPPRNRTDPLCNGHSSQKSRGKELTPLLTSVRVPHGLGECEFNGCEKKPYNAFDPLCPGHRSQRYEGKTLTPLRKTNPPHGLTKCAIPACKNDPRSETFQFCNSCDGRMRTYGLTAEELASLLEQDACSICHLPFGNRVIYHCHTTSAVRGAVCQRCNMLLGMAQDNVSVLLNAIRYLNSEVDMLLPPIGKKIQLSDELSARLS